MKDFHGEVSDEEFFPTDPQGLAVQALKNLKRFKVQSNDGSRSYFFSFVKQDYGADINLNHPEDTEALCLIENGQAYIVSNPATVLYALANADETDLVTVTLYGGHKPIILSNPIAYTC